LGKIKDKEDYNKMAFEEVFGNDDDIGAYLRFQSDDLHAVFVGESPANPCRADFICDVDNVLSLIIRQKELLTKFIEHYIIGNDVLQKEVQRELVNRIGQELRGRSLVPVATYFKILRKKK